MSAFLLYQPAKANNNLFDVMRGMVAGMSLLNQLGNNNTWGGANAMAPQPFVQPYAQPYPQPYPPAYAPGYPPSYAPGYYPPPPSPEAPPTAGQAAPEVDPAIPTGTPLQQLQGSWQTESGELLLVKGKYARLYRSRDAFQDLQLRIDGPYLWIGPVKQSRSKQYAYRIQSDSLLLRDAQNNTLEFRRFTRQRQ